MTGLLRHMIGRTAPALTALSVALAPMALPEAAQAQTRPEMTLDLTGLSGRDAEARKIAVTLTRGVRSGRDLPTQALRTTRARMVDGKDVTIDALRALADAGDGVAALRLITQLEREGFTPAPENLAHYYGIAATTGRVAGLFGLVRALEQVDPAATSPARLKRLKRIVLAYAQAGNSVATSAVMTFHIAQKPFGPMADDVMRLANSGQGAANAIIALQLAGDLVQTDWDNPDGLVEALRLLDKAATSDSIRISLIADNFRPVLTARIALLNAAATGQEPTQ